MQPATFLLLGDAWPWLPSLTALLAATHFGFAGAMTGIMWFVQLAYYPNLRFVGVENYEAYEREHIRRVNTPAWGMLCAELATAIALPLIPGATWIRAAWLLNLLLVAIIWWSTWFVQVPLHRQLSTAFEEGLLRRLVRTNWLRTACYSLRMTLLLAAFIVLLTRSFD